MANSSSKNGKATGKSDNKDINSDKGTRSSSDNSDESDDPDARDRNFLTSRPSIAQPVVILTKMILDLSHQRKEQLSGHK